MDAKTVQAMAADPAAFRQRVMIDADSGPVPLSTCVDDWQRTDFEAMDPGWRLAVGHSPNGASALSRAYLERPRGHSKTTDLAVMATWALAFARKRITGAAAAGDRDQARLLRARVGTAARLTGPTPSAHGRAANFAR